jgi:glycosyltransferase involved in cell wall biosynthesis
MGAMAVFGLSDSTVASAALGGDVDSRTIPQNNTSIKRNVLFVQESPCIRNYKMATALRKRGHRVTLAYSRARLSQMYPGLTDDVYSGLIHIESFRHLWDISKNYDIVHCHNEPDILTVAALACPVPVIHDTHDLISLRANGDQNLTFFEGVANRGAAGRVYTTPYQLKEAQKLYGVEGPCAVLYNYTVEDDLPRRFNSKLSQKDGQIHLVYEGGIGTQGHRNYFDLFFALAKLGVHLHIYPTAYVPEIANIFKRDQRLHYYKPLSPKQIMEEMTQYDAGIIPFNTVQGNKRFLDSTIANKLFEYLAAGLPVIASSLQSYIDYFNDIPAGRVFHTPEEALESLRILVGQSKNTDFRAFAKTYESEIWRVEKLYGEVLGDSRQALEAQSLV